MNTKQRPQPVRAGLLFLAAALLQACGGGAETEALPAAVDTITAGYTGPAPATDDVQSFKINVWDNVQADDRCGNCHAAGGQSPAFARSDDINLAYTDANAVVDLSVPGDSRLVSKVAGGHNCWLGSDAACGDIMTTWISAWAGAAQAGGEREIELVAPPQKDAGASRSFPDDASAFAVTVYPLVEQYCAACHASTAAIPRAPYFAESDVDIAYAAARSKIDLDQPEGSRVVSRLREEFHNCWTDCSANAQEMEDAVAAFAAAVPLTEVDAALVISKALGLYDGTVASGGSRYEANAIAVWEFKTGAGSVAYDTSGIDPALDLTMSGEVDWVGGWGIELRGGKAQASTTASGKLHRLIQGTGEYSIEAWAVPANVTQEESRIVSYSAGTQARNFTLGQTLYNYDFFNRATATDANGAPALSTPDDDEVLQATLQHVVVNFDPVAGRSVFVNGVAVAQPDSDDSGSVAYWDDTFALVLGNEVSGDRPWFGTLRMVAIHNRALDTEQIAQNFAAGVGEKYFLLFGVGDLTGVPESYVMFEVSRFDSYAYLFADARFVILDPQASPGDIPLAGMRIGINGAEAEVGQAWSRLDTRISDAQYGPSGQPLSGLGTVLPLEKGPEADEFFLSFDLIGANTHVRTAPVLLAPPEPADQAPRPDIGIRTFDEINSTLATLTGVSAQQADVAATYTTIRQQLPAVEDIEGFLSAHQIAVAQLAIEYCNALVDDTALRASYFAGFDFAAAPDVAFADAGRRAQVIDPLLSRVLGDTLASQPDASEVGAELDQLIDRLTACGGACAADRTGTVVKAVCSGVFGSAAMLLQ